MASPLTPFPTLEDSVPCQVEVGCSEHENQTTVVLRTEKRAHSRVTFSGVYGSKEEANLRDSRNESIHCYNKGNFRPSTDTLEQDQDNNDRHVNYVESCYYDFGTAHPLWMTFKA